MTPVALPRLFDLSAATQLADTLRAIASPFALDGAAVERIGVAGIQLLLSARLTAQAAGHALAIEEPSEPLRAALRTAGAGFLLAADC